MKDSNKLKQDICDSLDPEKVFMKHMQEEHNHYRKTGIPRCNKCKKNMKHGVDSITKEVSEYIWEYDCDCYDKNFKLMIG